MRPRQNCGAFPIVAVPMHIDDEYLDVHTLHELRHARLARGTGPVTIVVDTAGAVTVTEETS